MPLRTTNKFFIRSFWHYRTYVFQTQYTQTASLAGSVHPVSVGIDGDGTPTSEYLLFAVTNTAVSNSNSTGGDSRIFCCDLTRGGHPYVVDQTTTVDGLLPMSTMQPRGISRRCEFVFALITTTEQPNGHSRHAIAFRIYWRRISRFGLHPSICSYHHRWKTTWSTAPTKRGIAGSVQEAIPLIDRAELGRAFEFVATYRHSATMEEDVCSYAKLLLNFRVEVKPSNSELNYPANLKEGIVAGNEI